jgi:hypothetical protein
MTEIQQRGLGSVPNPERNCILLEGIRRNAMRRFIIGSSIDNMSAY